VLPTLPEEITPIQSSRTQALASIPWEKIEEKIEVRVEHRLGEVMAVTVKHGGHNKKQPDAVSGSSAGLLPVDEDGDLVVTYKQSSRTHGRNPGIRSPRIAVAASKRHEPGG
jgi:hypothetical protein